MMNALVVYFSNFGNTRSIAETIGEILEACTAVEVISSDDLKGTDLVGVDLVVFGTPTHNMNLPKTVKPVLASFPKRVLRGAQYAAFDTSYKMSAWLNRFTAAKRLDSKLCRLGGKRIASPMTFHVEACEGPLFPGELEQARIWAEKIGKSLISL